LSLSIEEERLRQLAQEEPWSVSVGQNDMVFTGKTMEKAGAQVNKVVELVTSFR